MLKFLAFGIGVGMAIQGWRNFPGDGPETVTTAMVVSGLGLVAAYLGGRWHGRHNGRATAVAVASAEATATATNQVNLAVVIPGGGAAAPGVPQGVSWFDGERVQVTADDVDGMSYEDLGLLEHPTAEYSDEVSSS